MDDKTIGGCIRTPCLDAFCRYYDWIKNLYWLSSCVHPFGNYVDYQGRKASTVAIVAVTGEERDPRQGDPTTWPTRLLVVRLAIPFFGLGLCFCGFAFPFSIWDFVFAFSVWETEMDKNGTLKSRGSCWPWLSPSPLQLYFYCHLKYHSLPVRINKNICTLVLCLISYITANCRP